MTGGVLSFRLCDRSLECGDCPLDLALRNAPMPATVPAETEPEAEFPVPERIFLHPAHLWVRLRPGGEMEVGVDDLARRLLSPVREVRLPEEGDEITAALPAVTVGTDHGLVALPAPFDGVVVRANPALAGNPELLSESPYEKGWLFRGVSPDPMAALAGLLRGEGAASYVACEAGRARDLLDVALANDPAGRPERCEEAMASLPPRVVACLIEKLLHGSVRFTR
jgi:glycine cleavage system H protein